MPEPTSAERLRYSLQALVQRQRAMTHGQRRVIGLVLSVLVAFLLWFTFSLREHYTVVIEMPIEIGRIPEDRALREMPPARARVALQGVGLELMRLRRNPPSLIIHATDETVDLFAAASESPRLPAGVIVQSVSPGTIHLQLDPRVSRRVPIELVNAIRPAADHDFLSAPRLTPDSVTVSGSRVLITPFESFPTESLRRDNVRESVQLRVSLADTLSGLISTDISAVDVTVPVGPFTEGRREITVRVEGAPVDAPLVSIFPSRVQAIFRVPLEQYERAERAPDFYAFVPFEVVAADTTGTLQPVVQIPAELTIRDVRLEPRRVRYWLVVE